MNPADLCSFLPQLPESVKEFSRKILSCSFSLSADFDQRIGNVRTGFGVSAAAQKRSPIFSILWTVCLAFCIAVPALLAPNYASADDASPQKVLDHLFLQGINDINANRFAEASGKFTELQKAAAQRGLENLPSFSVALIERAEAMLGTNEREKAAFLLRRAEELSPRDPKVLFALSRFSEVTGAGSAFSFGLQALRYSLSSPLVVGTFLVNIFLVGLVALTLSLGLVCVVQFVRSTDLVFARVSKVLPQYCRGVLSGPLVFALMILPAFGGILLAIVCWSVVLSRSVPSCRRLALAAGLVTAAWGLSLPLAAALLGTLGSRSAAVVSELNSMSYSPDAAEVLASSEPAPLLVFAKAQSLYFDGQFEAARAGFRKIASKGDAALTRMVEANVAAISLAEQNAAAAKTDLLQLESDSGPSFESSYNLALVSLAELDTEAQRKFYEQARAIDPGRLARLESLTEGHALPLLTAAPKKLFLPFLLHSFDPDSATERSARRARESAVAAALVFGAGPTFLVVLGTCISFFGLLRRKPEEAPAALAVSIGALWKVVPGGRALCGEYPASGACLLAVFLGFLLAGTGVPVHLVPVAAVARDSSNVFFAAAAVLVVIAQLFSLLLAKRRAQGERYS